MKSVATFILILAVCRAYCQQDVRLSSPDGAIQFSFQLVNNAPAYNLSHKGKPVISNAILSLSFLEGGTFRTNLKIGEVVFRDGDEDYELVIGKTSYVHDQYKEVIIPLEELVAPFRHLSLRVRVFKDGVAFRYEFPTQKNWTSYSLTDESTTFRMKDDPTILALFLPGYTTSHEGPYRSQLLSQVTEGELIDLPALFEFPDHTYLAITEAALVDYAGMYLAKQNGVLTSKLSPLPNQGDVKVKAQLPHHTPWRVMMISDRIGALIESNILTSLNEPTRIQDTNWIKPGKTTFPWWNGNVTPDTTFAPGNNFETNKYYIDFCARNGLAYHSVVEYGGHEWYMSDGLDFQPGPHTDVTRTVPSLDMKQICDYAKSKNVGIRVWVHWGALYPKLDEALIQFEKWGIKGMMVDFMDRDDQEMVNIQEEILRKAAAHKLHIQFHGAYKPTGLLRTYPNEFTREGTLNYEVNKWGSISPDHDINIPFTRMLAGPTDYHLGGFRAVPEAKYKTQYTRPLMLGTRCHMLAMYVVIENYQGMLCDYPEAYEGQSGFDFLKAVPVTWDETKVLGAKVGEFVTVARRSGNGWWIGSITNTKPREITIDFSFLSEGDYELQLYSDATDVSTYPNHLIKHVSTVDRSKTIQITLAAGGGQVMYLKRK